MAIRLQNLIVSTHKSNTSTNLNLLPSVAVGLCVACVFVGLLVRCAVGILVSDVVVNGWNGGILRNAAV